MICLYSNHKIGFSTCQYFTASSATDSLCTTSATYVATKHSDSRCRSNCNTAEWHASSTTTITTRSTGFSQQSRPSHLLQPAVDDFLHEGILQPDNNTVYGFRLFLVAKPIGAARPVFDYHHGLHTTVPHISDCTRRQNSYQ